MGGLQVVDKAGHDTRIDLFTPDMLHFTPVGKAQETLLDVALGRWIAPTPGRGQIGEHAGAYREMARLLVYL